MLHYLLPCQLLYYERQVFSLNSDPSLLETNHYYAAQTCTGFVCWFPKGAAVRARRRFSFRFISDICLTLTNLTVSDSEWALWNIEHSITLHYTTLHYTPIHYTTLHYTTLPSTTLKLQLHNCTSLHYTPLHAVTLHYVTLHYTALHCTTLQSTTVHYTTLHYFTLHYIPLR